MSNITTNDLITVERLLKAVGSPELGKSANKPKLLVFEYTTSLAVTQCLLMDRKKFEDGRHRVVLHPDWQPTVEQWVASFEA